MYATVFRIVTCFQNKDFTRLLLLVWCRLFAQWRHYGTRTSQMGVAEAVITLAVLVILSRYVFRYTICHPVASDSGGGGRGGQLPPVKYTRGGEHTEKNEKNCSYSLHLLIQFCTRTTVRHHQTLINETNIHVSYSLVNLLLTYFQNQATTMTLQIWIT